MSDFGPGVGTRIETTDDNFLIIHGLDLAVARSQISDFSQMNKFGRNSDVDTGGFEDIWDGGATWTPPTQARTHDIAAAADDNPAGTGAWTVQVYGLDADGLDQNETVTLNGTANVATDNTYTMIHRMVVRTAGSAGMNAGNITATAQTDSTVTAQITTLQNQTLMAIYQIPSNKTGYMLNWYATMNRSVTTGAANIRLRAKPSGEVYQIKHILGVVGAGRGGFNHRFGVPLKFEGGTIIKVDADASANDTDISAGFDLILVTT